MNNKLLVLGVVFILLLTMNSILGNSNANLNHSLVIPSGIVKQFEVNITNNQSIATSNPIQVPVRINKTYYSSYLVYNGSIANFEFYYNNGTVIPSWIESNNSTTILVWLKLYSIPADSTVSIFLGFASTSTNLLNSTGENGIGEAPELSKFYGKYDDGLKVFDFYDNFAGTGLNTSKWSVNGITYTVNNGFKANLSSASNDGIWSNVYYSYPIILDYYGNPYQSSTFWVETGFNSNTSSNNTGTFIQSYDGDIFGQQQIYVGNGASDSKNSNNLATSNLGNQTWTIIWKNSITSYYQLDYGNIQSVSGDAPSRYLHIGLIKSDSGKFSDVYYVNWIRVRAYPPNGIMPIVNIPGQPLIPVSFSQSVGIVYVLTENITTPFILDSTTLGNYPGLNGPIISKYVPSGDLTEFFAPVNMSHTLVIKNLVTGSVQYVNNFYDIGIEDHHFFPNIAPFQMSNGNILDIYSVGANGSGDPLTVYVYFINNNTLIHRSWVITSLNTPGLSENSIFIQISNSWFMGDLFPSSSGVMQIMAFNIFSGQVINASIQLPLSNWNSLAYVIGTNQSIFQINDPLNHTLYNLIQWISYQGSSIQIYYRVVWFYSPLIVGDDDNNMPCFEKKLSNGTYLVSLPGSESTTNAYYFNSFMYVYPNNPYKDVMFNVTNMSENGVPDVFTGTFITQSGYQIGGSNDNLYISSDDPYQTGFFNWFNSSNIITNVSWFNSLYSHEYAYGYIGHGTPAFTPYSAYFGYFGRENGIIPYNSDILSLAYFSGVNPTVSNISYSVINNNPQIKTYNITFQESGLISGTVWSLIFNSNSYSSNSSKIIIKAYNGTYSFSINSIGYYQSSPSSGSITINGNNVYENITFTKVISYQITFIENGLTLGITWEVTLNSIMKSSSSSSIVFNGLQNGTYSYSISVLNKWYSYSPKSGILTINGVNITQDIQFNELFSITFIAEGLSSNTVWSLTLNSSTYSSNLNDIIIPYLSVGFYSFYINNVSGYSISPQSGSISLNQNITEYIKFTFNQIITTGNNNNGNIYYNQPIITFSIAESFVIYLIIGIFIIFIIFGAIASVKRR